MTLHDVMCCHNFAATAPEYVKVCMKSAVGVRGAAWQAENISSYSTDDRKYTPEVIKASVQMPPLKVHLFHAHLGKDQFHSKWTFSLLI